MGKRILFASESAANGGPGYFPQDLRRLNAIPNPFYEESPNHPSQFTIVHVSACIKSVEQDVKCHGVFHHHLLIDQVKVLSVQDETIPIVTDEVFVAIRYGDRLGLPGPIIGLQNGQPIELKGEYIDKNHVYPAIGNPGDPVIHFIHNPVGFVTYDGTIYQ